MSSEIILFLLLLQRWAVDLNSFACQSLKHNHPQTEVCNKFNLSFSFLCIAAAAIKSLDL